MSVRNEVLEPRRTYSHGLTRVYDTDDATYDYYAAAPRQIVAGAADFAAASALAIWYIERTTKVSPHITQSASVQFDQKLSEVATITSWA